MTGDRGETEEVIKSRKEQHEAWRLVRLRVAIMPAILVYLCRNKHPKARHLIAAHLIGRMSGRDNPRLPDALRTRIGRCPNPRYEQVVFFPMANETVNQGEINMFLLLYDVMQKMEFQLDEACEHYYDLHHP